MGEAVNDESPSLWDRFAGPVKEALKRGTNKLEHSFLRDVEEDTDNNKRGLFVRAPPLELTPATIAVPDAPSAEPAVTQPERRDGFGADARPSTDDVLYPSMPRPSPPPPTKPNARAVVAEIRTETRETTDDQKAILYLTARARTICINAFLLFFLATFSLILVVHSIAVKLTLGG